MPSATRDDFHKRVTRLLRDYDELIHAVQTKRRKASLEVMLSEQAAMSLGVYWEAFVHDLFVAYITSNPANCVADLKKRVDSSVKGKFNLPPKWVKVSIPAKLTEEHIQRVIDPKGWNVAATSAEDLRIKANQFLHSTHARNFSLGGQDAEFVDFLVVIRNFLAHRSRDSKAKFKSKLSQVVSTGLNPTLVSEPTDVGSYLRAICAPNTRRIHRICTRLVEVSSRLVP